MSDPYDDYKEELRSAANLYATDRVASRIAAVSATISFLRGMDVDPSLRTPLLDVHGHLDDERMVRTGNTKPVINSVNDAAVSAVITLAMRTGATREQAAKIVASHIGLNTHKPAEVRRLLQSRKNLMDKRASREALNMYELMLVEAGKAGISPQNALRKGLDFLRAKIMAQSA